MDIMYEGLTAPTMTNVAVMSRGNDQYDLQFTNLQNTAYDMYLVSNRNGVFNFGSDKDDLVFVEAANATAPNIGLNDYFTLSDTRSDTDKSVSSVLRYEDIDTTNHVLYFTDIGNGGQNRQVTVSAYTNSTPTPGNEPFGTGDLVVGGHTFKVFVENWNVSGTHSMAVDQNADGLVNAGVTTFTTLGGGVVSLSQVAATATSQNSSVSQSVLLPPAAFGAIDGNGMTIGGANVSKAVITNSTGGAAAAGFSPFVTLSNPTLYFSLRTLAKNFDTSSNGDETINWTVSPTTVGSNNQVTLGNIAFNGPLTNSANLYSEFRFTTDRDDSQNYKGMSDFGVGILEYVPNSGSNPNTLTLAYPAQQRLAQVFVVGGTTSSMNTTSGDMTQTVNPIAVGLAVLDKDAPAIGSENMIIVGGPCANTVAAAALGNPAQCSDGFEPGKAMIKSWENNGKVAILVAGYESTETLGATRVLAAYKDYQLTGSEVEVVVADLNSIKVQAPTMAAAPAMTDNSSGMMMNNTNTTA